MASIIPVGEKWRAQVRRKGHDAQTKTFEKKADAERWARRIESEIEAGRSSGSRISQKKTIAEVVKLYREEVSKTKPFGRGKEWCLARLEDKKEGMGAVAVATLSVDRIVKYIVEQRKVQGVTASIDLTYLGGVLTLARTLWKIESPRGVVDEAREALRHMGLLARSNERDRRPTQDELDRLRAWFRRHSRSLTVDVFDFILDSCFRPPSEIVRLRWDDLNEEDRTIVIHDRKDPRRKKGNDQVVPLLGRCMDIIQRQPRDGDLIFPFNGKSWSSIFPRACEELKIVDLQLYDLRHEAITRLVESGKYSVLEMCLVTGHKDPKQLKRYTQLRAKNLHR